MPKANAEIDHLIRPAIKHNTPTVIRAVVGAESGGKKLVLICTHGNVERDSRIHCRVINAGTTTIPTIDASSGQPRPRKTLAQRMGKIKESTGEAMRVNTAPYG